MIICLCGHKDATDAFMERISKVWSMKIQGDVHGREFMGVRIHRGARVIEFDQERAILDVLKEWNMSDCKGRDTPVIANLKLPKIEGKCNTPQLSTDRKLGREVLGRKLFERHARILMGRADIAGLER
jgi:hypothetical protein